MVADEKGGVLLFLCHLRMIPNSSSKRIKVDLDSDVFSFASIHCVKFFFFLFSILFHPCLVRLFFFFAISAA